jgi:hypothetical protein
MKLFGKDINVNVDQKTLLGIAGVALSLASAVVGSKAKVAERQELKDEVTKEVIAKLHSKQG